MNVDTPEGAVLEQLHLCGATGVARTEIRDGREYLVVPVVALMEGVIHPVNAETPEYVPLETLKRAAQSWNGRPVTLGHPKRNGTQCSANDPDTYEAHAIGMIWNSHVEGHKMLQEAWIDKVKAKKLHLEMYNRLEAGKTEEVSVGTFVITGDKAGAFNNKDYKVYWQEAYGDHLAFLPGGRGACSVEMGCGTHRAAMHFVAAESIDVLPERLPAMVFSVLEDVELGTQIQAVYMAVDQKFRRDVTQSVSGAYVIAVYDDYVVVDEDGKTYQIPYTMTDMKANLGVPKEVKKAWVAAEGTNIRVAAGARHSTSDVKLIQAVHDHAMALGAMCDRGNYKAAASPPLRTLTIRHEGGKWVLYTKDGSKKLGSHNTEAEAVAQEKAIEAYKHRRAEAVAV
jgi:hypothetical protein